MFHPRVIEQKVLFHPSDRKKCNWVTYFVILQCIAVFLGSATILDCVWKPRHTGLDIDKLARIMYLYDSQACGYNLNVAKSMSNIKLSNDTGGHRNIMPIKWTPPLVTVSTRLSAKTRTYIKSSLIIHILWMIAAIILWIFVNQSSDVKFLKKVVKIFYFIIIFIIVFDLSMALVYVTHIKQSLTNGMVLRYSGWSTTMKVKNYSSFAGWLPIIASVCWLRGVLIFMLNIYLCRLLNTVSKNIKKREIRKKFLKGIYTVIPEAGQIEYYDPETLLYRSGEKDPYVTKK